MSAHDDAVATVRAAAKAMRERAQAATPGTWSADDDAVYADADLVPDGQGGELLPEGGPMEVAYCFRNERGGDVERAANAAYIAALHPGVGLLLADWLDNAARQFIFHSMDDSRAALPLAVARAYLGTDQEESPCE